MFRTVEQCSIEYTPQTGSCIEPHIGRFYLRYNLKVPKREIFVTELFIRSDPIWVGDLRTEPKKPFV
jgi:hypothetical protein